jgi:hypothetical protein
LWQVRSRIHCPAQFCVCGAAPHVLPPLRRNHMTLWFAASAASVRPAKFKKKLSTRIGNADMIKFQETFSARMSGDMDGLKRKRGDAKDKVLPLIARRNLALADISPIHRLYQSKVDKRDKAAGGGKK